MDDVGCPAGLTIDLWTGEAAASEWLDPVCASLPPSR
jgi:hypothetical protein